jgi:hypothetical protein
MNNTDTKQTNYNKYNNRNNNQNKYNNQTRYNNQNRYNYKNNITASIDEYKKSTESKLDDINKNLELLQKNMNTIINNINGTSIYKNNNIGDIFGSINDSNKINNNKLNLPIEPTDGKYISKLFDVLMGNTNKIPSLENIEEDELSDYDSEDEFEEIDTKIETLDDLIKLIDIMPQESNHQFKSSIFNSLNNKDSIFIPHTNVKINNQSNIPDIKISPRIVYDSSVHKNIKKNPTYSVINGKKYGVNFDILKKLKPVLIKLKNMIGLIEIKNKIVDMILYYIQHLESNKSMLHTIIEGSPGVGKTELGKILAEIYAGLGIIESSKIKLVRRTDLIGEHLGSTAQKTQKAIDDADGGVLFIDEAYALGSDDKKDIYAKECIDTLNYNLSENRKKFICIIAGYPDDLEKCFFSINKGLKRRFPFKYSINGYNYKELYEIFIKKLNDSKWNIDLKDINDDILLDFFKNNSNTFVHYGGDIENLIINCKFMHSKRIFGKHPKYRRNINNIDIVNGFDRFKESNKKDDSRDHYKDMFY